MRHALLSLVLVVAACSGGSTETSTSTIVESSTSSNVPDTVARGNDSDVTFAPLPAQPRITTTTTTTEPPTTTTSTTTTTAPTTTTSSTTTTSTTSTTTTTTTTTTSSTTTTVPRRALTIQSFAFSPTPLNVAVGTRVTVTNRDSATHTWTADNDSWDSGDLAQDDTFTRTFATTGTFDYACTIHPNMTGRINVT